MSGRGEGTVYHPIVRGERSPIWMCNYTRRGCTCGECDATGRHRESLHLRAPESTKADAYKALDALQKARENGRGKPQPTAPDTLAAFVELHLAAKAATKKFTPEWLAALRQYLKRAVEFFGPQCRLASITAPDVAAWSAKLQDDGYAPGSVLHHLGALSNLFKRARAQLGAALAGHDPVGDFDEKPDRPANEAKWLEVHDASLLLEAARGYHPQRSVKGGRAAVGFAYELLATFLLTGGREAEALGLEVGDVSFDRKTVTFRPNQWRRLKTKKSHRVVPLWPQLEEILRPYVFGERPPSRLLFPSYRTGEEAMLTDWRKLLDAIAERGGWKPGEIRSKQFRHGYITARLQTLDRGAPVSAWTLAREVGHSSTDMIEETYGHLGEVRHRSEFVEFRVEQHAARLGQRLFDIGASNKANVGNA